MMMIVMVMVNGFDGDDGCTDNGRDGGCVEKELGDDQEGV
jgi:hypothetical protein